MESSEIVVHEVNEAPILAFLVGLILLLGCVWVLAKCFRLLTGKKTKDAFMSPTALRIVSVFLLVLPVVGLFTGYSRETGAIAIYQAVAYFSGFFGLLR